MKETGLFDKNGTMICDQDWVSLDGNITADNSMGFLPNGWTFDEDDVYKVYFDESIQEWSLELNMKPDSAYNVKYMNHAVGLLHDKSVEIVTEPKIEQL